MIKTLACMKEIKSPLYVAHMEAINAVGACARLDQYYTYSRIWEYPWLWQQLRPYACKNLIVLDIGSERSPFPWYLSENGFRTIASDYNATNRSAWRRANHLLSAHQATRVLDAQYLTVPTASIDVYLSVSVIEHVPDKPRAIAEAARVLKPGGLLVMSFDICEHDMGMTFPSWNGRAITMAECDSLFRNSPWFEHGLADFPWNTDSIAEYWAWHKTTAPHHNYITGALVIRRNEAPWNESPTTILKRNTIYRTRDTLRIIKSSCIGLMQRLRKAAQHISPRSLRHRIHLPLESIPNSPDLFRSYRTWLNSALLKRNPGGWEYKGKFYPDYLTVGGACHAIFRTALQHCRGQGIDIGAGFWPLPGATAVDLFRGPGLGKTLNDFADQSLDYVFSSHCLEHIEAWQSTLKQWVDKAKIGGIIFLYLPHPDCGIWQPGSPMVGDGHKWSPSAPVIRQALENMNCQIIACDEGPDAMQSFFVCAKRLGK